MIVLHIGNMPGENVLERTNGKCHVWCLRFSTTQEKDILEHTMMENIICVHCS